jgi:hypothetical protein
LIELWVRPGLQQELTTAELEDRINDAIAGNAGRAQAEMNRISESFVAKFSAIPGQYIQHPVGTQLARAYNAAVRPSSAAPAMLPTSAEVSNWERGVR